jgi:peptide deformylase
VFWKVFVVSVLLILTSIVYSSNGSNSAIDRTGKKLKMNILSIDDKKSAEILAYPCITIPLTPEGLADAKKIADQLLETIKPLMPAAGLAAPQIGISKRIFIYSWNRSDMEVAINPTILHQSNDLNTSWEACFSATQKAALVTRSNSILVSYFNLEGNLIKKQLDGFSAKVFQHEYEHLEGIVCVNKAGAESKVFESEALLVEFMKQNKKIDSLNYKAPNSVS